MTRTATLTALCLILVSPLARAADVWTLTSADLSTTSVKLAGIDAAGVKVANPDGGNERVVAMDRFVELERPLAPAPPAGKFVLYLTTGDQIAGDPVGVKGESIVWKNAALGEVAVSLRQLRALARPGVKVADVQRKEDVATLTNKDVVRGAIAGLSADKISLQTDAGAADLPLDSVESLAFAATPNAARDQVGYRVRLDDGSSVVGSALTMSGDKLTLTIGDAPRDIDFARVAGVEQVNGPVAWLSSRTPSESVFVPYLQTSQPWPARMNASAKGDPIRFKDRVYTRGIGVHSYSRLVFPLDGKTYTAFRTRYALDPAAQFAGADVTVRIKLDDKVVHEQPHVRRGVLSPPVVLDLGGAKSLTLEVDYGDGIFSDDLLNWIEPALLKVKPAADAAPATQPGAPTPTSATTQAVR